MNKGSYFIKHNNVKPPLPDFRETSLPTDCKLELRPLKFRCLFFSTGNDDTSTQDSVNTSVLITQGWKINWRLFYVFWGIIKVVSYSDTISTSTVSVFSFFHLLLNPSQLCKNTPSHRSLWPIPTLLFVTKLQRNSTFLQIISVPLISMLSYTDVLQFFFFHLCPFPRFCVHSIWGKK